jgi:hypothetical protein
MHVLCKSLHTLHHTKRCGRMVRKLVSFPKRRQSAVLAEIIRCFTQLLQVNTSIVPQTTVPLLPSI